jgi:hypothetical protein
MIQALGGLPVANVVLAAGSVGETKEEQAAYEKAMYGVPAITCRKKKRWAC